MRKIIIRFVSVCALSIFSLGATASIECFDEPPGYDDTPFAGEGSKRDAAHQGFKEAENPAGELMACFVQAGYEGPRAVVGRCGCLQAIRQMCSFRVSTSGISVSAGSGAQTAWCMPFIFLAM